MVRDDFTIPRPAAPCAVCATTGGWRERGCATARRYRAGPFGMKGFTCKKCYDKLLRNRHLRNGTMPRKPARAATAAERDAMLAACRALVAEGTYPTERLVTERVCGKAFGAGCKVVLALRRELLASGLVDLSGVAVPRRDTAEPSAEELAGIAERWADEREAKAKAERPKPVRVARAGNPDLGHAWRDW